jgi:ABC-type molybdate transport system substrate-binding protein
MSECDRRADSDTRHDLLSTLSRREFISGSIGGVLVPLLASGGLSLFSQPSQLVVWSCGGNYDLLRDFHQSFERENGCRVSYASAPVEHLISVLARRPQKVDILVGRSGPGWSDLASAGRLATQPQVFALDPYVIIVPKGNPGHITGLTDLKRSGVKTVYSPRASGPSGKVVQYVLQAADEVVEKGIWAGYVRNAIEAFDCGWKVFPAVAEGRAHASVVRLSMTTAPETRGTVETIAIPVEVMAAMRGGHGAIPQRVAVLADAAKPQLARLYVEALTDSTGLTFCSKHGYVHRLNRDAPRWRALFHGRTEAPVGKGLARRRKAGNLRQRPNQPGAKGKGKK